MKKFKKPKKLFIEDLEIRRSTSPLLVNTMAVGEGGAIAQDNKANSSSAQDVIKNQESMENLIAKKNDDLGKVICKYAPAPLPIEIRSLYAAPNPPPVELVIDPKIRPIILKYGPPPVTKYAPPLTKYAPPMTKYAPPLVTKYAPPLIKYAPPITTTAVGEEGKPPKPIDPVPLYAPPRVVPLYGIPNPPVSITTEAIGEEGNPPKPNGGKPPINGPRDPNAPLKLSPRPMPPIISKPGGIGHTTQMIGEEGSAIKPFPGKGNGR